MEKKKRSADHMRLLFLIFETAVCVLFLLKLRWPKTKNIYDQNTFCIYFSGFFIKLQNFTLHRIHFNTFFLVGGGGGGGLLSGVQYIWRGLLSRVYFFCFVGRWSSAGGGAEGEGRGAKKRKFYTVQSTRVNIWLRLERQVHASSMSTSIYSKSLHLIIILFNYRNRKK